MGVSHGVAQVPQWRILGDYPLTNSQSKTWQAGGVDGGLLGVSEATTSARAVSTYLKDDWARDWGRPGEADAAGPRRTERTDRHRTDDAMGGLVTRRLDQGGAPIR